jgi:hypothetical protein
MVALALLEETWGSVNTGCAADAPIHIRKHYLIRMTTTVRFCVDSVPLGPLVAFLMTASAAQDSYDIRVPQGWVQNRCPKAGCFVAAQSSFFQLVTAQGDFGKVLHPLLAWDIVLGTQAAGNLRDLSMSIDPPKCNEQNFFEASSRPFA